MRRGIWSREREREQHQTRLILRRANNTIDIEHTFAHLRQSHRLRRPYAIRSRCRALASICSCHLFGANFEARKLCGGVSGRPQCTRLYSDLIVNHLVWCAARAQSQRLSRMAGPKPIELNTILYFTSSFA